MLTPAEELGLSGLNLAGRVRQAFSKIPEPAVLDLIRRMREEAFRRHLVYLRDGTPDAIHVLPSPLTVLPDQLSYVHFVSLTILNALKRLPDLYIQDFAVREVLRLIPTAEAIVGDVVVPELRRQDPSLQLEVGKDVRELLMQEAIDHLESLGRRGQNVCFIEPKYAGSGP